jgi:hypothetical protein
VRWDIISLDFTTLTVSAGGVASAIAQDGSHITSLDLEHSSPLRAGMERRAPPEVAARGKHSPLARITPSASGTYSVTGLVRWDQAPGTFPANVDAIDDVAEAHGGLAVLRIEFSDGSHGVLTVSCHFNGTPNSVFEGIRVTKGYVDYWNGTAPVGGVNANRTVFHVN